MPSAFPDLDDKAAEGGSNLTAIPLLFRKAIIICPWGLVEDFHTATQFSRSSGTVYRLPSTHKENALVLFIVAN